MFQMKFRSIIIILLVTTLSIVLSNSLEAQVGPEVRVKVRHDLFLKIARFDTVEHDQNATSKLELSKTNDTSEILENAEIVFRDERAASLIIFNKSGLIFEKYRYGLNEGTPILGWSMTKSVASLAVGTALCEGHISNLDDIASKYVKELAESSYGKSSIKNLLKMASGVEEVPNANRNRDFRGFTFREDIEDKVAEFEKTIELPKRAKNYFVGSYERKGLVEHIKTFTGSYDHQGSKYIYNSKDSHMLGLIVSRATGMKFSKFLSKTIWRKIGAEKPGLIMLDPEGEALTGWGYYATGRDWIRLGNFIIETLNGKIGGKCFQEYLKQATSGLISKEASSGEWYGYQFHSHTFAASLDTFEMRGIGGQRLIVNPKKGYVIYSAGAAINGSWIGESGFNDLIQTVEKHSN